MRGWSPHDLTTAGRCGSVIRTPNHLPSLRAQSADSEDTRGVSISDVAAGWRSNDKAASQRVRILLNRTCIPPSALKTLREIGDRQRPPARSSDVRRSEPLEGEEQARRCRAGAIVLVTNAVIESYGSRWLRPGRRKAPGYRERTRNPQCCGEQRFNELPEISWDPMIPSRWQSHDSTGPAHLQHDSYRAR